TVASPLGPTKRRTPRMRVKLLVPMLFAFLGWGGFFFLLRGGATRRAEGSPAEAPAGKTFNPPRTAVVEIAKVFDLYEKKKDRQEQLQGETKVVEEKLKDLETRNKDLDQELKNLEEGPKKDEKTLEKVRLGIEVKGLKERELKRLRETQFKYLEEIR